METPLVSVIIPAYNAGATLGSALESALRQTYKNLEILVVDDGSTDATEAVARTWVARDGRVRVYRNGARRGVSYNRNFGVQAARGEYVAYLDSDDLWLPDKLEKQMALAQRHPEASLFFTGSGFISAEGKRYGYVLRVPERVDAARLAGQNVISCSSVLARRETMLTFPMENDRVHEDFAVWLRVLNREKYAYGVDEPLLIYRVSGTSKSGDKRGAARMTWATYRYVGFSMARSAGSFAAYTLRSLRKYSKLRRSLTEEDFFRENGELPW